jgi:hypothetical protein
MKNLLFLLLFSMLFSCKEKVFEGDDLYFENPQPMNESELREIPSKFLGLYKDADSVFLKIDKNRITKYYYGRYRIHKSELDSMENDFEISNGNLIEKKTKATFETKKIEDSIELSSINTDTIFQISNIQKLKRINGNLLLNFKRDNYWQVNILTLKKKTLNLKYLSVADLNSLDSVMTIKATMIDSINYLLKPSRKEFKKISNMKLSNEFLYQKL